MFLIGTKDPCHLHVKSKTRERLLECGRAATAFSPGRRRNREQTTSATHREAAEKASASRPQSKARLRAPGKDEIPGSFALKNQASG